MNVSDLMNAPVRSCGTDESCSAAARMMWEGDCGCVPVIDPTGKLAGVVTDRDLCMAAYTTGRPLDTISIARAMATDVRTCLATTSVEDALATMSASQVHRLPVVDTEGQLVGVVALSDILLQQAASPAARAVPVVGALAAIHRRRGDGPVVEIAAASAGTAKPVPTPSPSPKTKPSRSKR